METVDKVAFGRRLAERRAELGLSARMLADRVDMKQQGIDSIEKGKVARPGRLREIAIELGTSEDWLLWGRGSKSGAPLPPPPVTMVPVIDQVTAGRLASPNSQIPVERVPLLAFADLGPGDFFATLVKGTSMDRVSPDGSIIVVNRRDKTLISGRCYLFALDGETTYKRWQGGDPPYLEPYSTDSIHKPIFPRRKRDLEVIGRVKRTLLDL